MPEEYILALDQGTSSSRAILFDRRGFPISAAQREFEQIYPRSGWVEHDAEDIWRTQLATSQEAIQQAGIQPGQIRAIGVTNQRETLVVWDRETSEPIHNAIVWQCRRTADECSELRAQGIEADIKERTGLVLDPYFSATKISWLLDHVPGARDRAIRGELAFGTIDSFLMWRLSGGDLHITDASNASRTLLFNIHSLQWDETLLELFDIPLALLPEVVPSAAVYGSTIPDLFDHPIPLAGILGDQQSAAFGQSCFTPGMVKNTYGTGCFILMNTGQEAIRSESGLLTTVGWSLPGHSEPATTYFLEGSVFIAGAVIQWLRDGLGLIQTSDEVEHLAEKVPNSDGVYFVPAFVGLGAPHWDPYARGTILGLTRGTSSAHIARAALEAIAFQTLDILQLMRSESGFELMALRADGGASANELLLQTQADLLGIPVQRPLVSETTALGAAYAAGLAVEFWHSIEDLSDQWRVEAEFHPQISASERSERSGGWKRAVQRSMQWATRKAVD
jgi:glycerol kinase